MRPDLVATDNPRNPREYLDRFFFDSWVADPRALQYLLDTCGAERVMLGTDYPFPLGEQTPGAGIDAMDLDEAGKARLFHGTALEWLGLPKSRFSCCLQERTWARPGFPGKATSRPGALLQAIAEPDMTELHSEPKSNRLK